MARFNVLAMSGRAVEASGDVDVILLDKTGTITYGNRLAASITAAPACTEAEARRGRAGRRRSGTRRPEGRSIVELARKRLAELGRPAGVGDDAAFAALREHHRRGDRLPRRDAHERRQDDGRHDDPEGCGRRDREEGRRACPTAVAAKTDRIADLGATPLVLESEGRVLGVIELKDTVKEGLVERFAEFRRMGIRTVMITGDNPRTAATIAKEAGVDDFIAQATPGGEDRVHPRAAGRGPPASR